MSPDSHPLNILKSGLVALTQSVDVHKKGLLSCLQRQEKISAEDENWLDNEANYVDEVAVIDFLEKASNFRDGFAKLTRQQRDLVEKLEKLGGGVVKQVVENKRKHVSATIYSLLYVLSST